MKFQIKATAPTSYQLRSLRAFQLEDNNNGNGSHTGRLFFDTEEEAKDYLRIRADKFNDEDPQGSEERLAEMYSDIERCALTLDAVTAYISESDIEEEEPTVYVIAWEDNTFVTKYGADGFPNGTTVMENATEFESEEEAQELIDANNWINCYVTTK